MVSPPVKDQVRSSWSVYPQKRRKLPARANSTLALIYGGRLVSKLHSDAFAKLEHVLLSFEYAFFILVWSLHLGMLFSFGYGLCIWVCSFHSGMVFAFGYALFIRVWSLRLGMLFSFGYGLCVWVCSFYSGIYGFCIWVCSFHSGMVFAFGYALFIRVWCLHLGIRGVARICDRGFPANIAHAHNLRTCESCEFVVSGDKGVAK